MDEMYNEWQKEENNNKGKWDILGGFSEAHQIAVIFGNFNYQVENGGIEQWIYNGYFHDDVEKFIEYLETGAKSDERCQTILGRIYTLDQYAKETGCDRDGYFHDPDDEDGESSFIGDNIDCNGFDSWYYEHCGNDDWWETVCGIIDKAEARAAVPDHPKDSVIAKIREDMSAKTGNAANTANKWDSPVDVVCQEDLTTFPTRRVARDFFFEGMCATDGAERDRYTAIFIGLVETDGKMVHDGETWEEDPCIRSVSRFKGDHIGDRQLLDEPTTYNGYVGGKDSVIAKIREAKAAAKSNPPAVRDKPQSKKSHEPEV
jgi:hypothetical protein